MGVIEKLNEEVYLERIYNLILDAEISEEERAILLKSKNDLEQGNAFLSVMYELKMALFPLGINQRMTASVVDFYTEVCRKIPTTGAAATWNIFVR